MNVASLAGLLRHLLTTLAGYAIGKGLIPEDMGGDLVAGGMALAVMAWSAYQKMDAKKKADALASAKYVAPVLLVALMLGGTLSACSADRVYGTAGAVITATPELKEFTLRDISNARDMAFAQNDVLALTCYDYLLVKLPEMGIGLDAPGTEVVGAISAFQKARGGVKAANTGVSEEFKVACYPLIMDAKEDIQSVARALGRLTGGAVLTGGLAPAATIGSIAGGSAAAAAAARMAAP